MRPDPLIPPATTRGITLIEVMIAILVLSIGTVAAFRVFDASRHQIAATPQRLFAEQVAMNRAAEYRALGMASARALPERVEFAGQDWALDIAEDQTSAGYVELRIRAYAPDGAGALLVTFLPPEDSE